MSVSRTARIFLSSTFRDFGEERDLLVRKVFPGLRSRLKDRFVELVDVDLRWGITAEQAERGEVLPICLAEIDRSRPFFVGLLGERYGWVPEKGKYPSELVEQRPWLRKHQGGKSVTELEILHGVLNNPKMAGRALFYFRSAAYAKKKGGDYLPQSPEDRERQQDLKARIRDSGFPVVQGYKDPEALAKRLERDLWKILDEMYPADEVPDALAREAMRHEAYAAPRRGLYLGGEAYLKALDEALASGRQWILIGGQSGGGKSALIANWTEALEKTHEDLVLHVHYLGATADASDPVSLVRRLVETIRRTVGSEEEIPGDPDKLLEALPLWLANASSWAGLKGRRFVIVIDALNGLTDRRDLRWLPSFLPERVQLVVSSLPGEVQDHLREKAEWTGVAVRPLDREKAEELFVAYLRRFNKELPPDLVSRIMDHVLVANPLFLRTLAEELRLFGVHERLGERLAHYLTSRTVDDLFERVLERVEEDNGADAVRKVMVGLWASRAGLTEEEIRAWADLKPAEWAYIRNALGNALLEGSGRIVFGHDYLRIAVSDRYLAGNNTIQDEGQSPEAIAQRQEAYAQLARWFEDHAFLPEDAPAFHVADARAAEEIPHQWREAKDWDALRTTLTRRNMFEAMVSTRGNQELLSYWLDIEANTALRIEREYERAWIAWAPDRAVEATGEIASILASFLQEAGKYQSSFVEELIKLALGIVTTIYGEDSAQVGARLDSLASLLQERGDYDAAGSLYRHSLAITERTEGPEHPETGKRLNNLATLLIVKADYDAAEQLCLRALAIAEKTYGSEHRSTSIRLSNLARLLFEKGDYDAAEPLYRRVLAIDEKALGPDHPETGLSLNNLATLLLAKGDYVGTESLFRRALKIAEKTRGPEHPETGLIVRNLGGLLHYRGDYEGAEPLVRRALAVAEKAWGLEHPETAACRNNLAALLVAKGEHDAAEPLSRQALEIAEKVWGLEHPATAEQLNNLASLLLDKGDQRGAEPLYRRALAIAEKAQGSEHPETGRSLHNLAILLKKKGDNNEAELLCRRALLIAEKAQGPEHPETVRCLHNLAVILDNNGDYEGAELLYRRALAIEEKFQGPEHPSTGTSLNNLVAFLCAKGDYEAAEPLCRRALAIAERSVELQHSDIRKRTIYLAECLATKGNFNSAEALLRKALSIGETTSGPVSADIAPELFSLGNLLIGIGQYTEGEQYLRRELAITEMTFGTESIGFIESLTNLGMRLHLSGQLDRAELPLQQAVDAAEELELAGPFYCLADLRISQARYHEALALIHKCLAFRRKKLGPDDPRIKSAIDKMSEIEKLIREN